MSDDLITWLRAQVDEDERVANEAATDQSGRWTYTKTPGGDFKVVDDLGYSVLGHYDIDSAPWWTGPHVARHDPARVLREVEAKRRILDAWEREDRSRNVHAEGEARAWLMDEVVAALALPYSDRPGYRDEWRP